MLALVPCQLAYRHYSLHHIFLSIDLLSLFDIYGKIYCTPTSHFKENTVILIKETSLIV